KPFELRGVDDRLEVLYQLVERRVGRFAVREAAPARVVAMETVAGAEGVEPRTPHRRLPVAIDVGEPVGGSDERKSAAMHRVRQARAIGRASEANVLIEGRHESRC